MSHKKQLTSTQSNTHRFNDSDVDRDDDNTSDHELMHGLTNLNIKTEASASNIDTTDMLELSDENDSNLYEKPVCSHGLKCFIATCPLRHPRGWHACESGSKCKNFYCEANHPYNRTKCCRFKARCHKLLCEFLHPPGRRGDCPNGDKCRVWRCHEQHPNTRPTDCPFGSHCYNTTCQRPHPPDRDLCSNGIECAEYSCTLNHPSGRMRCCDEGNACDNAYCAYLHPHEWDPRKICQDCEATTCSHASHLSGNVLPEQQENKNQQPSSVVRKPLKSVDQRNKERQKAQLPILAAKDEFCQRLEKERILVVTAETGSGKSTQLPQYAAEYFGGLVVCTQPRVIAAISLARRVADEYDGISVGKSVGYRVGHASVGKENNRVPGTDIIFATDAALICESQDNLLRDVKVLIIDEAHERSLHTDILIGIAKLLLRKRPSDFYVVISSATVDPTKFLEFFQLTRSSILNIPGRLYDISVQYLPMSEGSIVAHAVSTLLKLYNQHQGHTLVFLPGAREIHQAIELFNRKMLDDCVALPLYSALSLEQQNQVLEFDEGPNRDHRMVVFCTNIAETSVTIKNVRLIIDSGLAKGARFDNNRRFTSYETMTISRSSASQRTGRAGRTAPGHCVRLYKQEDLVREHIEPAILRSSLDLTILQLLRLKLNPEEFPFIDPPDTDVIQTALKTLQDLSCIDADSRITERGLLTSELGFDPRYSAFLIDCYLEHAPILELVTSIVAILVGPSIRADLVGAMEEEKTAAQNRIKDGAREHDSDLLFAVALFKEWRSQGSVNSATHICNICHKPCLKEDSCSSCREAYSLPRLLNNRNLCILENSYEGAINTIKSPRWKLNPATSVGISESQIIGTCLLKHFPDRYGEFLRERTRQQDVHMVYHDLNACLHENSVFSHRTISNPRFIAMSIAELRPGFHIVTQLHPLHPTSTVNETFTNGTIVTNK